MQVAHGGTTQGAGSPDGTDPARHEAVIHSSPADLAAQLAPRITSALAADQVVVAVLDATHHAALRSVLGDTAGAVEFADPAQVHDVPGFTVAMRWARTSRRATQPDGRALVIGQHIDDLPGCGPEHWPRLDIALNVATPGLPITVLCPVAANSPALPQVAATHPLLTTSAGTLRSRDYRLPREALIDYPPPPPPELGPPLTTLAFGMTDLPALRHLVGEVATGAGLADDRVADVVLAVNELASNATEHGPGGGVLRLWDGPPGASDDLVAEVADAGGTMDVPFPGLTLPPPGGTRGRGLWLASELCDVLQVWSDPGGTVTRVRMSR